MLLMNKIRLSVICSKAMRHQNEKKNRIYFKYHSGYQTENCTNLELLSAHKIINQSGTITLKSGNFKTILRPNCTKI